MSQKKLLLLVTRAHEYRENEWSNTRLWGLPEDQEVAYIELSKVEFTRPSRCTYDLVVINGNKKIGKYGILFSDILREADFCGNRALEIKIHLNAWKDHLKSSKLEKTQKSLLEEKIKSYTIGDEIDERAPIVKLAQIVQKIRRGNEVPKEEYEEVIEDFFNMNAFSKLRYRIVHLWLPLDIDLQGIQEVRNVNQEDALVYLKDVLKDKKPTHYRRKLADLQFMVAKVKQSEDNVGLLLGKLGVTTESPKTSQENETFIPLSTEIGENTKISISEILKDKNQNPCIKNVWENLLELSGLNRDEKPKATFKSPIFQFVYLLDRKIGKLEGKKIELEDLVEILGFKWENDSETWKMINSFHQWFEKLVESISDHKQYTE